MEGVLVNTLNEKWPIKIIKYGRQSAMHQNVPPGVVEKIVPPGVVEKSLGSCEGSVISTLRGGISNDSLFCLSINGPDDISGLFSLSK